jgi:hypothetical protein
MLCLLSPFHHGTSMVNVQYMDPSPYLSDFVYCFWHIFQVSSNGMLCAILFDIIFLTGKLTSLRMNNGYVKYRLIRSKKLQINLFATMVLNPHNIYFCF